MGDESVDPSVTHRELKPDAGVFVLPVDENFMRCPISNEVNNFLFTGYIYHY